MPTLDDICKLKPQPLADSICRVNLRAPVKQGLVLNDRTTQEILDDIAQNHPPRRDSFLSNLYDIAHHPAMHMSGPEALEYSIDEACKWGTSQLSPPPSVYLQNNNFGSPVFVEEARAFLEALVKQATGEPLGQTDKIALGNFNAILNGLIFSKMLEVESAKKIIKLNAKAKEDTPLPPGTDPSQVIAEDGTVDMPAFGAHLGSMQNLSPEEFTKWRIEKYRTYDLKGAAFDDVREFLMGCETKSLNKAQNTCVHLEREVRPMLASLCRQLGIPPKQVDGRAQG